MLVYKAMALTGLYINVCNFLVLTVPAALVQALYHDINIKDEHQMKFVLIPYYPAVTPPFRDLFPGKRGGGRGCNNKDLRFCLAVNPPPSYAFAYWDQRSSLCVENSFKLTCHTVVLKEEELELLATYMLPFLQNTAGSLTARLLPPAARLHSRMTCRISGLGKLSQISEKT